MDVTMLRFLELLKTIAKRTKEGYFRLEDDKANNLLRVITKTGICYMKDSMPVQEDSWYCYYKVIEKIVDCRLLFYKNVFVAVPKETTRQKGYKEFVIVCTKDGFENGVTYTIQDGNWDMVEE